MINKRAPDAAVVKRLRREVRWRYALPWRLRRELWKQGWKHTFYKNTVRPNHGSVQQLTAVMFQSTAHCGAYLWSAGWTAGRTEGCCPLSSQSTLRPSHRTPPWNPKEEDVVTTVLHQQPTSIPGIAMRPTVYGPVVVLAECAGPEEGNPEPLRERRSSLAPWGKTGPLVQWRKSTWLKWEPHSSRRVY